MAKKDLVITIGGPPGAGTTTIAKAISEKLNLRYVSMGSIFRKVAKERRINVEKLSETAEKEVDEEVDARSQEEAKKGSVIIDGDLAAWKNPDADVKIWLTAPLKTRAMRILNSFEKGEKRVAESYSTLEEVEEFIGKRFSFDKSRYRECYNIDIDDLTIYDIIVDNEELSIEETINKIVEYIDSRR